MPPEPSAEGASIACNTSLDPGELSSRPTYGVIVSLYAAIFSTPARVCGSGWY